MINGMAMKLMPVKVRMKAIKSVDKPMITARVANIETRIFQGLINVSPGL
jgi:hypothetical protein